MISYLSILEHRMVHSQPIRQGIQSCCLHIERIVIEINLIEGGAVELMNGALVSWQHFHLVYLLWVVGGKD